MEEPLLAKYSCRRAPSAPPLCILRSEEWLEQQQLPCTSMYAPMSPSCIKERLIFGSPAAAPAPTAACTDDFAEMDFARYSTPSDPSTHYHLLSLPVRDRRSNDHELSIAADPEEQVSIFLDNLEYENTTTMSTSVQPIVDSPKSPKFSLNSPPIVAHEDRVESPTSPKVLLKSPYVVNAYEELQGNDINVHAARASETEGTLDHATRHLFRSRTAPAIFGINRLRSEKLDFNVEAPPSLASPMSVVSQAFIGLMIYLSVGMLIYTLRGHEFSGATTNGFFDALYFCIVTMCTIGYGDITPVTPTAKLFSCAFVLVGFGFIDVLLSAMVSYVLQKQETLLLNSVAAGPHETAKNYLVDVKKGRMRIRSKVFLAFGVVIMCIGIGTFMMGFLEGLCLLDAFYLSCMSVTTVGYGDHAFKTLSGRVFASVWLLVSTLAVTQSFLYLAEARIDKRHRLIAKWVLEKEMTLADLLAADLDNDGSVSKSDFVVYKLKQMGKIDEKDAQEICRQFSRLDPENSGKITLSCLINLHKASTLKR